MNAPFVRTDVRAYLDMAAASGAPKFGESDLAQFRAIMPMMRSIADLEPVPLAVVRDISIPGPAGSIPARLYDARETREAGPVMVFMHGGGFVVGDLDSHEPFCTEAAKLLDIPVIALDYRLAPEHPFPAAPDDCEAAARWIAGSPAELGRTVTGIIPCGDSAGGNLTIVTAIALRDKPAAAPVIALCPYYPVVSERGGSYQSYKDFSEGYFLTSEAMQFFTQAYNADVKSVRAYPLNFDLSGLPPTLLTTAGLDPLRDQGRAFAAKLIESGVQTTYREAVGTIHGFLNVRKVVPSAQQDTLESLYVLKAIIAEATA